MKNKQKRIAVLGAIAVSVVVLSAGQAWAQRDSAKVKEFRALQKRTEALIKAPQDDAWSQLLNDVRAWAKKHRAEVSEQSGAATGSAASAATGSSGPFSPCEGKLKKRVGKKTVDCWLVPNKSTDAKCFYICTGL